MRAKAVMEAKNVLEGKEPKKNCVNIITARNTI